VHVRDDLVLVMSGAQRLTVLDTATNTPISGINLPSGGPNLTLRAIASDLFNNAPSAGATLTVTADGCELLGDGGTVPNTNSRGAFSTEVVVVNLPDNTSAINGSITFTLTGSVGSPDVELEFFCVDEPL
jgi:hypothetical protein